ncbi:MAG TPA: hypothetical protein DFR83_13250, partial [Deltaproteobacteria bacterium]|nr:hypothetical protein [Deltaproteobacteria bacterium]
LRTIASGSEAVNARLLALTESNNLLRQERDALASRSATLHSSTAGLEQNGVSNNQINSEIIRERDALRTERDTLAVSQTRLQAQLAVASQEAADSRADLHASRSRSQEWSSDYEALRRERDALREERNRLATQHVPVLEDRDRLRQELGPIRISRDQANQALEASRSRNTQLREELDAERARTLELAVQLEQREPLEIEWDHSDVEQQTRRILAEARVANDRLQVRIDELASSLSDMNQTQEMERNGSRELQRRLGAAELEAAEARKQQIQDLDWFMEALRAVRSNTQT